MDGKVVQTVVNIKDMPLWQGMGIPTDDEGNIRYNSRVIRPMVAYGEAYGLGTMVEWYRRDVDETHLAVAKAILRARDMARERCK